MAWNLIAHNTYGSSGGSTFTTAALNTAGCDLLVMAIAAAATPTVTSSPSNTWNTAVSMTTTVAYNYLIFAWNATGGASQTFTITGSSFYASIYVQAWSGSQTTSTPLDQTNSGNANGAPTLSTGSITPGVNGELIVAGVSANNGGTNTGSASFTIADQSATSGGNFYGGAGAYFVQATAAAIADTWANASGLYSATIASFKPSSGGSTSGLFLPTPMNGLGVGGPFFPNPTGYPVMQRRGDLYVPERMAA
jgi:hypothetical protein